MFACSLYPEAYTSRGDACAEWWEDKSKSLATTGSFERCPTVSLLPHTSASVEYIMSRNVSLRVCRRHNGSKRTGSRRTRSWWEV